MALNISERRIEHLTYSFISPYMLIVSNILLSLHSSDLSPSNGTFI